MYFFKALAVAVLATPLAILAQTTHPYPTHDNAELLYQFPNGTWVENLAVRSNDQVLVTLFAPKPQLYQVDPAKPGSKPKLIYTFPNATSLFGITETEPDVFQVIAQNFSLTDGPTPGSASVWTVDFSGGKAQPKVSFLTAVPQSIGLNGMCTLPQQRESVLLGDLKAGKIFRLNTKTKKITTVIPADNYLTGLANNSVFGETGVNGIHIIKDQLYLANTGKGFIARIRINPDGTVASGAKPKIIQRVSNGTIEDDFAVDEKGTVVLVTVNGNSVVRLTPDGKQTTLAGNLNSTEIAQPTSAAFSRASKQRKVFVTTAGGQATPVNGNEIVGGQDRNRWTEKSLPHKSKFALFAGPAYPHEVIGNPLRLYIFSKGIMQSFRRASWRSLLKAGRTSCERCPPPLSRPFSRNCQLLLSRIPQRAQLPYLHSTIRQSGQQFQIRFFRLFTIREPKTLREAGVTFLQVGVVFYTAYGLWKVAEWGILQEASERSQPTPREYSFKTRIKLREALAEEEAGISGSAVPNWKDTGDKFLEALERLEDRKNDGKALRGSLGEDEDIFVAGVGRTGLDVSTCSEPWRRGYYQALMGAGRCAERLDGWVRDRTRSVLFPEQYVVGPSYPDPKPVPPGAYSAPREEDCDPAFEAPQKYYLKVITTQGFSTGQRLRAALAYADWLRYKGLNEAAEGMHTWAVDIALEGVPDDPKRVVDNHTGVLKPAISTLTPNLLLASESFGTHFALTGNMSAALPVFLSILRAQQNLPPAAPVAPPTEQEVSSNPYVELVLRTVLPPKYPPAPASGDDPITKNPDTICASTATMTHIGEVLFASDLAALSLDPSTLPSATPSATSFAVPGHEPTDPTPTQAAGLAWTRQAAELAEATLRAVDPDNGPERFMPRQQIQQAPTSAQRAERKRTHEQQKHCAECLTLALDNWVQMVERFERAERHRTQTKAQAHRASSRSESKSAQQSENVRRMMTAAYQKDAQPDDVLAAAARTTHDSVVEKQQQLPVESPVPQQQQQTESRGGWGWFWSSKLGLAKAPADEGVLGLATESQKGPWELEAIKVRAQRREARLLARQLGLED